MRKSRKAFTVVELIVTCAIIAIVCALLIPVALRARRSSQLVACSATLQQLGAAFANYSAGSSGWWPMDSHMFAPAGQPDEFPNRSRTRYWFDMISGFVGEPINRDGDQPDAILGSGGAPNLFRACPMWSVENKQPAFAMNPYPFAAKDRPVMPMVNGRPGWVRRGPGNFPMFDGWYARASQWDRASHRCLLVESISIELGVSQWPWWTGGGPMPQSPNVVDFSIDYTRHRNSAGQVVNVLFCDGHVAALTPRDAYDEIIYPN